MASQTEWVDDTKTVILLRIIEDFGIEDYGVMEGQIPMMVREVDHNVDVILVLTPGAKLPPVRGLLREIEILLNVMPPNFGKFIGVGEGWLLSNSVAVAFGRVFINYYFGDRSSHIRIAPTVAAALETAQA